MYEIKSCDFIYQHIEKHHIPQKYDSFLDLLSFFSVQTKLPAITPPGTALTLFQESGQFQCFVRAVMLYTVHQIAFHCSYL